MSAPGHRHELAAATLATLATLAGYRLPLPTDPWLQPDLARRHGDGRRLIADAKSTERPGCTASGQRLGRYARFLRRTADGRVPDTLGLAYCNREDGPGWARVLREQAALAGLDTLAVDLRSLDEELHVVRLKVAARHTAEALDEQGPAA